MTTSLIKVKFKHSVRRGLSFSWMHFVGDIYPLGLLQDGKYIKALPRLPPTFEIIAQNKKAKDGKPSARKASETPFSRLGD